MFFHVYDAEGYFTGEKIPLGDDTAVYANPAPPHAGVNQIAKYRGGGDWELVPNFAGTTYYLDDAAHVMTERGVDLPAGAALEKPQAVIDQELSAAKTAAIVLIGQKANEFHSLVVGTADKSREARFALNLELAQKLLAGTANAIEQQALQIQLDANQQAGHPVLSGKTLEQFAVWIVQFKTYATLGSGLIEATLIKGRAAINAAQSIDEIEQIKAQLATQAQTAFEQLQARVIPPHA